MLKVEVLSRATLQEECYRLRADFGRLTSLVENSAEGTSALVAELNKLKEEVAGLPKRQ